MHCLELITLLMKKTYLFILLFSFWGFSCSSDDTADVDPDEDKNEPEEVVLQLVDKNATEETKALYSQLWKIQSVGTMFGHHESLAYGRSWKDELGRSDVKEIVGDYPAVYSSDFSKVEQGYDTNINGVSFETVRMTMQEARRRGEVITMCWHVDNPLTGGDSWDNSSNQVAKEILTEGSEVNIKFKSWLDKLADFNATLTDDNGNLIPIIFRPFHEHTQTWSWWGRSATTQQEFIALWKFTVDYLRDTKGVHNFIYAISPQMDSPLSKEDLLFRYPGDDYVDFLGMDCYHGTNTAAFMQNLRNLSLLSQEKKKPSGVTETGIEGIRKGDGSEYSDYWTKEMLTPLVGRKVSLVVMWRNQYDPTGSGHHFYGPWADHSSAADFVKFYESPITLFSSDLPDMYTMADGVKVD